MVELLLVQPRHQGGAVEWVKPLPDRTGTHHLIDQSALATTASRMHKTTETRTRERARMKHNISINHQLDAFRGLLSNILLNSLSLGITLKPGVTFASRLFAFRILISSTRL